MSNPLKKKKYIYIYIHISIVHDDIHSLIGLYIMHQLDYEILMDLGHIRVRPLVVGVCLMECFFFPSFPKAEICPDSLLLVLSLWTRDYGGVHEAIWDILLLPPHS